jgi:subtilisin family serine protease
MAGSELESIAEPMVSHAMTGEASSAGVDVMIYFTGGLSRLVDKGFEPTTVAGDVVAGFIPFDSLDEVAALENVWLIESARPLKEELDKSVAEMGVGQLHTAMPPFLGEGVIVGIIDSGIDYLHQCFQNDDQSTRILAIWDQNLEPHEDERSPSDYTYGVEYDRIDIQRALDTGDPQGRLRHKDRRGHGTHVAGIAAGNGAAAGNGLPPFTFVGVAPKADIIVVATKTKGTISNSNNVVNAIEYLLKKAKALDKPIVINISQGDNLGAHDGTGMLERAIDHLLRDEGQVMVKSAGNGALFKTHASGTVPQHGQIALPFTVPEGDRNPDTIELWYSASDSFDVALRLPGGIVTNVISPGACYMTLGLPNGNRVLLESSTAEPLNGDSRIFIQLEAGSSQQVEPGDWEILLIGRSVINGRFHAWIDEAKDDGFPVFTGPLVQGGCTITSPGTARKIITVGAYITNDLNLEPLGQIAPYSSIGPTRDGRKKPDVVAPGEILMSPRIIEVGAEPYSLQQGTSMAAPHVTGVIALMLQKNRTLTAETIKDILVKNARKDDFTGPQPDHRWGFGKINAQGALTAV